MYLFEQILLCCKEMNASKQKNKVLGTKTVDKKGRPRLQLKGRIFMQNVTDTVTFIKPGLSKFLRLQIRTTKIRLMQKFRVILIADILEGRSGSRVIHHQVHHGRRDAQMVGSDQCTAQGPAGNNATQSTTVRA
jgi:hypothetical protein